MPQNATKDHTISHRQEVFLLAMMTSPTRLAASVVAGISDETARRWLNLPEVQEAYQAVRKAYLDEALTAIIRHTTSAIETIARNMKEDAPPGTQVRAAQILLEQAIELNKISTLEAQIEELKAMLEERNR